MKFKHKKAILVSILTALNLYSYSYASNLSVTDQNKMLGAVSKEWESANIREWLNSNENTVNYTSIAPSYKNEAGFLSNKNFTQNERDAIAITKHSGGWQYSINNKNKTLYVSQRELVREDFIYNDKVFLLNYSDLFNFIERNDKLLEMNTKFYSNYLQKETNKMNKYAYLMNSGYVNDSYTNTNRMYSSDITGVPGGMKTNIAPALSLKPEYTFPDGVKAKNLKVGSIVIFGRYNNEPIKWRVINKSESGYPLLFSEEIIAIKEYDAPGDINPLKSRFINFSNHEVSILSNDTKTVSWKTGNIVKSFPEIIIHNEDELTSPSLKDSIVANIEVLDTNYSISEVILPDGNRTQQNSIDYTISENGGFTMKATNSEGVVTVRHFLTKALNQPLELTVNTTTNSDIKWINKPINVTVSTNKVNNIYELRIPGEELIQKSTISPGVFPSNMSLGGKRLRITGTLKNCITDEDITRYNMDMSATVNIRTDMLKYTISKTNEIYPLVKTVTLQELKDAGEIHLDFITTINPSYYAELTPVLSIQNLESKYAKDEYRVIVSNFKFEILDKDDSELKHIILPNGEKVNNNSASYSIDKRGEYTFKAEDTRGKIVSKTINVDIDMKKPTIETKQRFLSEGDLQLDIIAKDDLSGIKYIKLPNGEYRENSKDELPLNTIYNIKENGTYRFEVSDFAGNIETINVVIDSIDKEKPSLTYSLSPSTWTSGSVTIQVSATDTISGVKYIVLPDGSKIYDTSSNYTVSKNGDYSFIAIDRAGNSNSLKVKVRNIDSKKPSVEISRNPNTEWTNTDVEISIKEKEA